MSVAVTVMPLLTFLEENVPLEIKVTASPLITPDKVPPERVAVVVASYTLLEAVSPVTDNEAAVMLAVNPVGWVKM